MGYSTVQYCTVQCSTVQYCTVLYSTVQYCTVLCSTVQYCTVQYSTVLYSTVQYCTVLYSTFRRDTDVILRQSKSTTEGLSVFIGFGSKCTVKMIVFDKNKAFVR